MTDAKWRLEEKQKLRGGCITLINVPVLHCIPWQERSLGMSDCGGEGVKLKRCLLLLELSAHLYVRYSCWLSDLCPQESGVEPSPSIQE